MQFSVAPDAPNADLFSRPALQRLFCSVSGCVRDEAGNVNMASICYLDGLAEGPQWVNWESGHVLHWHPFKLRLNKTPRAGLHITSEWRTETEEMRYGSNFKVREDGVFVLSPLSVIGLGENILDASDCGYEAALIERVLWTRFGVRDLRELLKLTLPSGRLPYPGPRILTH